jgi:succinate-semialdehyde dehydrogenase/glutarate-semialdehyde dehydrogenase
MPEVISPNSGLPVGAWASTPEAEIAARLAALPRGFAILKDAQERRHRLEGLAAMIAAVKDEFTALIVAEVGKTPGEAADEVDYAVSFLTFAAKAADTLESMSERWGKRVIKAVPAGPALLITPFNDPLAGITRKIGPALACGCPAIVKPSSLSHLTAAKLFACIDKIGLGDVLGLANHTDRSVLNRLVRDPVFRVLSFTGSTVTGTELATVAAGSLKRLILELGGNNPFLVIEGADVQSAVVDAVARKLRAAGQACSAQNRIYVVESLHSAFRDALFARLSEVTYGASDSGVTMGPVRTHQAVDSLRALTTESARSAAVHSFGRPGAVGAACAFPPTVVETDAALRAHEAFGPLMSLTSVPDRAAAFAIAATETQALACYVYGDPSPEEIAILRFGSIGINTTRVQGPDVPTGGFGTAGIGREGGRWGLEEFITTVNQRWT